jgi:hypothetical protein
VVHRVVAHRDPGAGACRYLVLRPDEATTLRRAAARSDGALTDPDPIRSPHRQFAQLGTREGHLLDSTRLDAEATTEAVLHGLGKGVYELSSPA